mmetsp:Transcript_38523/g.107359  ORF Transcript_38523/g.107359 Transcript_38523/m.107359 type:complete len:212 (-) Transcript_38523:7-642(-)
MSRTTVLKSRLPLMSTKTLVNLSGRMDCASAIIRCASKASQISNCMSGRLTRACATSWACWSRQTRRPATPAKTLEVPPTWQPTSRTWSSGPTSPWAAARYSPTSSQTTTSDALLRRSRFLLCLVLVLCLSISSGVQARGRHAPHSHTSSRLLRERRGAPRAAAQAPTKNPNAAAVAATTAAAAAIGAVLGKGGAPSAALAIARQLYKIMT